MSGFLRTVSLAVNQLAARVPAVLRGWCGTEPQSYLRYLALAVILMALSVGSRAQDVASITGTVTDKSGAAISDAEVKLTDARTGAVYESKTGNYGGYLFARVAPGPGYTLTVSKESFKSVTVSGLYLAVATTRTQDVTLEVGSVSQKVEVTSEGSVSLNTSDATIGNNFDIRAVHELPQQFRDNPSNLLRLEPGVQSAASVDDPNGNKDGSVTGARTDQNNIIVDGIDGQDFAIGQAFALVAQIPVDAVQEFVTDVANPTADFGRGSGATTIIATKSGTNNWHGSAREYHRNTVTEANSFFNNASGVPRPALIRNQFGANLGGPVKKDKLFFFFDYDGRRDARQESVLRIVPLDSVRNGQLSYINSGANCTAQSRTSTQPSCITTLPATGANSVASLDPQGSGSDPALLQFINSRYPHANDLSAGDGVNTGGFRFNSPVPLTENTYTTRVDYVLSSKHKLFTRFNFNNQTVADNANGASPLTGIAASVWFPGDPITQQIVTQDKAWVLGETWTISANTVNQFVYGESRNELSFQRPFNPNGAIFQNNWMNNAVFDRPFANQSVQKRVIPVPTFRDDFTHIVGNHALQFGGVWKPIRTRSFNANDLVFTTLGLGPALGALDSSLRPADILNDPVELNAWDNVFAGMLGYWNGISGVYNYGRNGNAFPHFSGARRDYRYYEYEFYGQDSWKIRRDLTLTFGLRYQYDSVPYESNGLEAVANADLGTELSQRVANGLAGISGNGGPLLTYVLGGKANHGGPSLYAGDKTNFAPRLAAAWNPAFRDGLLGNVLGDRKTVLRVGAAMVYDHTALSSINFIQDQSNYLFSNSANQNFGGATPTATLASGPRFTDINAVPVNPPAPAFVNPLTPFVANGVGFGASFGANQTFNYTVDPHFKTPYALTFTAGIQRELPGNFQLEMSYFGRFGRRLFSIADAAQVTDFKDPASGQTLVQAITALELLARQGATTVPAQPFFENQVSSALAAQGAAPCAPACTQSIYSNNMTTLQLGNLAGLVQNLTSFQNTGQGFPLPPGVGLPAQFPENAYISNKGWASYNGLLTTLRKRLSNNLQMDFNYTFSHSIDNFSAIANNVGFNNQIICDARNLNACRGNSEFDVTHSITAYGIYDLPIGRGQWIGRNMSSWLHQIVGGWEVVPLITWHTGFPFSPITGVSTTSQGADALGIFNGNQSAIATNLHFDPNSGGIQLFKNPAAAVAAFSAPTGQSIGNRDIFRGPGFTNVDLAVVKNWHFFGERYRLQFRAEAYNTVNHPSFALPQTTNINSGQFGQITATSSTARVLQFALRVDF
jgi:hypothetical protein